MSSNAGMDKKFMAHLYNGILAGNEKELTTEELNSMGESQKNFAQKKLQKKIVHAVGFHMQYIYI